MGWRPGQGIGPRLTNKQRQKKKEKKEKENKKQTEEEMDKPVVIEDEMETNNVAPQKVYGCSLPANFAKGTAEESSSSDDDIDPDVLYAPDDVESPLCDPKENTFGLGYKGLERMSGSVEHVDLFGKQLKFRVEKKKMSITGEVIINTNKIFSSL